MSHEHGDLAAGKRPREATPVVLQHPDPPQPVRFALEVAPDYPGHVRPALPADWVGSLRRDTA